MPQPTLTIDLDALRWNWRTLDGLSGRAETGAAIKADGYGLGAPIVAAALWAEGCRTFFVATLEEGIAARSALPEAAIYVLNGVDQQEAPEALAHELRPCLNDMGQIEAWRSAGGGRCALQLDSGMSRLGLPPEEIRLAISAPEILSGPTVDLILTHLACADDSAHPMNAAQLQRFGEDCSALPLQGARRSIAATGGTLLGEPFHLDLVRCGVGLYGGAPFVGAAPVVRLESPILQIRDIPAGARVGYAAAWLAERPSRIAILPMGYADGLHRALDGKGVAYLDGSPAPFAGRVSMDLIALDITEHPHAAVGDRVEILGPHQGVDALAEQAGTIGYEILVSLGSRYARRYKGAS